MKTKTFAALFMAVLTIALLAQGTMARTAGKADNWVLLGTRTVDYAIDHDVISLTETQPFTALKFKVKDGSINLLKCTVHFTNEETQDVAITAAASAEGSIIDLKGNTRTIEKVTFWYDTKLSSKKRAVIELWGKNGNVG